MVNWTEVKSFYKKFLEVNKLSSTYPHGMQKFIKYLEEVELDNSKIEKIWTEISNFSKEGNSDTRFKVGKALNGVTLTDFELDIKKMISFLEEQDTFGSKESLDWYAQIVDNRAFNILNKRIGNGIPNAVLNSVSESPANIDMEIANFFSIRCGSKNEFYNDFINNQIIAITWENLGDIHSYSYDQLVQYGVDKYDSKMSGSMFGIFRDTMNIGDIVLIIRSGTKSVQLAVITSDMQYDESLPTYYSNYRTIEIIKEDVEFDFVYRIQSTITTIYNENRKTLIKDQLDEEIMSKYNDVMSNIDIDRNFIFKYSMDSKAIDEDDIEFNNSYQQLIIDGAPGTSKSYSLNKEITDNSIRHERVTFYQDYEYHNFVGSILPVVNDGSVSYEFVKGPFTKLLNDAFANPESKHYLVIEELTRGNAPAIFGDIFQLLDRDSDGWSRYPISNDSIFTSLEAEVQAFLNSNINFKGKVVLPPNFSIICTINSSDQNVYPLDTAFKRRFNYEIKSTEASNDFNNFDIYFGNEEDKLSIDWIKFQSKLNDYILNNLKLNEDKQVGPYFIKESDTSASIQTKLAMYMWNDLQKVHTMNENKIFNDKVKTLYKVDELFRTGSKGEIKAILTEEFIDKMKLV